MPQSHSVRYHIVSLVMLVLNTIPSWSTCIGNCQCSVTTTVLSFGSYTPSSATSTTSNATVQIQCNTTIPASVVTYSIAFSAGNSGSANARTMTNGISTLNYNLYNSSNGTGVLGDGTNGTQVLSDTLNLTVLGRSFANSYSIYGIINAGQNPTVGTYNDSITVTITY